VSLAAVPWAIASFVVLAGVFAPLERAFPARPGQRFQRPGFGVDACFFFGQYLVFSALAVMVLSLVHSAVRAPLAVRHAFLSQPFVLQAIEAIVLGDVLVYWFHRACHEIPFLWRFHAVHHSSEHLDWLAAHREHPLDGIGTQLCQNLPAMLLGLNLPLLGALVVFRGAAGIFIHSNVKLSLGPLRFLVGSPELHHWHHARVEKTQHNFANLAPWLDVVFGTYHRPEGEESYPLGLTQPWPKGYLKQLVRPLLRAN
jgi:sterol desaturase/sphingolipid hydroxylase (fatty acid hydroxylase superfamily)